MGASMGGYGALRCALLNPNQYGFCCAFSSACLYLQEYLSDEELDVEEMKSIYGRQLVNDFQSIYGKELSGRPKEDIIQLAEEAQAQTDELKVYMTCGIKDDFRSENLRFRDEMKKLPFDYTYEEWQGGHNWYFFNESLKKALAWMHNIEG